MVTRGSVAALLGALVIGACDDDITQPKIVQLKHDDTTVKGDAGHTIPPPECTGACCPKVAEAPECYFGGKNPSEYSGAECMAQRDNTGADHWQLRQTQSISTAPPGNKDPLVAAILLGRSTLHSQTCSGGDGVGGFIQLIDLDRVNGVALTGFAAFVKEQPDALAQGLCFVEDTYDDPDRRIPQLYAPPPGWPKGLPAPQPLPWKVGPVRAYRYTEDFVLATDREAILARLADDPDLKGYNGIFYLDEARGYTHGYGPLGYVVTYDDATSYNAVPIREAEITSYMNDPAHPNCGGVYGANDLPQTCANSTAVPAWSCPPGNCAPGALGPTKVEGYFLTVEAEQVYLKVLKQSLCYRFPLPDPYPGWTLTPNAASELLCRNSTNPKWDPTDPVHGIPPGDWCAATNSEATPECHDAWKSVSYSTFQAFPIQVDKTCPAL